MTLALAMVGAVLLIGTRLGLDPLVLGIGRRFTRAGLDQAAIRFGWLLLMSAAIGIALALAVPTIGFSAYFYAKLLIVTPISGLAAWWITRRLHDFRIDPPRKA